ncbi:kinesin family member 9 [Heterostelium album PN500]|uniref:Kinesin family member 9 n=1 Tax=Heterostelium pallidum (strain ATCC 26659 / Pp 5 / PN500) TaxID=670386 RepID=D3AZF3_HETP5|nr:kinesin family member 9 [Heterostelium album PN500]EFA85536.1 kinesin family member 9 [Heterostelium album PN500]|eukprot:XP_020437644.1 kinesin family member 9 [Heterostelium album PN500]
MSDQNQNNKTPPLSLSTSSAPSSQSRIPLPPSGRTPNRRASLSSGTGNNTISNGLLVNTQLSNSVNNSSISNTTTTTIGAGAGASTTSASVSQKKNSTNNTTVSTTTTTTSSSSSTTTKRRATISAGSSSSSIKSNTSNTSPSIAEILANTPATPLPLPTTTTSTTSTTPSTSSSSSSSSSSTSATPTPIFQSILPSPLSLSLNVNSNSNINLPPQISHNHHQHQHQRHNNNSNNSTPSHSPSPPPDEAYLFPQYKSINSHNSNNVGVVSTSSRSRSPSPLKLSYNYGSHHNHTPISDRQLHDTVHNQRDEFVKVYCRFRPHSHSEGLLDNQQQTVKISITDDNHVVRINNGNTLQSFRFTGVLPTSTTQESVFQSVALPLVDDLLNGFNVAIIVYGASGSGKSYTIQGYLSSDFLDSGSSIGLDKSNDDLLWGIVPRTLRELINRGVRDKDKFKSSIRVSLFEVVQERVHDVLANGKDLELRLSDQGFLAPDALTLQLDSHETIVQLLNTANQSRSKGHLLFLVTVTRENLDTKETTSSLLYMVDLSGSEIADTNSVNKSLYALGGVIEDIARRSKHVRYRDSKLTQLLQNCLGGNSKTCLLVNCSSCEHESAIRDTLASLNFGERTQSVRNQPFMNHELNKDQLKLVVQQMRSEMTLLKSVIDSSAGNGNNASGVGISNQLLKMQLTIEESKRAESKLQDEVTKMEIKEREYIKELTDARQQAKNRASESERVDRESRALQAQLSELRSSKSLELERLSQSVDEWKIKQRVEVEFPAIAQIVNNQSQTITTTLESINNNISITSSSSSSTSTTSSNSNSNSTTNSNNETGEIMNTVKRIEDIFEKLTEQQQEQSTNIQSFFSNFDSNTFSTSLMSELDEKQLEQYKLLLNNNNNNNKNDNEQSSSSSTTQNQQQQQLTTTSPKKGSLVLLFCKLIHINNNIDVRLERETNIKYLSICF